MSAAAVRCMMYEGPDDDEACKTMEDSEGIDNSTTQKEGVENLLIKAFKALDYGSGQERGLRK